MSVLWFAAFAGHAALGAWLAWRTQATWLFWPNCAISALSLVCAVVVYRDWRKA